MTRAEVQEIQEELQSTKHPLNDQQLQKLVDLMYSTRKQMGSSDAQCAISGVIDTNQINLSTLISSENKINDQFVNKIMQKTIFLSAAQREQVSKSLEEIYKARIFSIQHALPGVK